MHDDTTATPLPETDPATVPEVPTDPAPQSPVVGPDRPARDLCMSVFDRWRCGLEDGHAGLHTAVEVGATTSWNDAVSGRMLRDL
ncbi:hypothetical protein QUG98_07440 [Curtobacterium sp. RHCJP20]|uniref:Uncharacterized protein n=1 Tax=Curtobacterium subtropicum TaxID=3055138 RepID=A0ABT7TFH0_9MICO|nr:hypothetical protein [Curtobacterium subtropicum]MDM7888285.1 hypothetical protein [Curtobacterium subtropicum]